MQRRSGSTSSVSIRASKSLVEPRRRPLATLDPNTMSRAESISFNLISAQAVPARQLRKSLFIAGTENHPPDDDYPFLTLAELAGSPVSFTRDKSVYDSSALPSCAPRNIDLQIRARSCGVSKSALLFILKMSYLQSALNPQLHQSILHLFRMTQISIITMRLQLFLALLLMISPPKLLLTASNRYDLSLVITVRKTRLRK